MDEQAEDLSQRAVAECLNAEGRTTAEGKPFSHVQVGRVLAGRAFYEGRHAYAGVEGDRARRPIL